MGLEELVGEIQRLRVGPDEVLVVRPRLGRLTPEVQEELHANLRRLEKKLGWESGRIVVLDRDIELSVVKAEQISFEP